MQRLGFILREMRLGAANRAEHAEACISHLMIVTIKRLRLSLAERTAISEQIVQAKQT